MPYWNQGSFVCYHCALTCRKNNDQSFDFKNTLSFKFECQCRHLDGGCSATKYQGSEDKEGLEKIAKEMIQRQIVEIAKTPI